MNKMYNRYFTMYNNVQCKHKTSIFYSRHIFVPEPKIINFNKLEPLKAYIFQALVSIY